MKCGWIAAAVLMGCCAAPAQAIEVLHGWSAGSEAAGLHVLKTYAARRGIPWRDAPLLLGESSGTAAWQARMRAGSTPSAAQARGWEITQFVDQKVLLDLSPTAAKDGWEQAVPVAVQQFSRHGGMWVAVPVAVQSTNWVWGNKAVLDKAGVTKMPVTWEEFIAALDQVERSGAMALAHGGQPWQHAVMFEGVVMSTGGIEFYRRAMLQQDRLALASDTMVKAFERMALLRRYVDKNFRARASNEATALVISGQAGFQITGDWARGEFVAAKQVAGRDFLCSRFPGTQGMVTFDAEQVVFFKREGAAAAAQQQLARLLMTPALQMAFTAVRGGVPARADAKPQAFDDCGKKGIADLAEASSKNTLVGSVAHGYALHSGVRDGFYDVIERHFHGRMDNKAAATALAAAAGRTSSQAKP